MNKNPYLSDWMAAATVAEQKALAANAGTSHKYLYRLASGERRASAELAGALEDAAEALRRGSKGRLPRLMRYHLCNACASCPFASLCKK